jgi:hypothetical protein
MRKFADRRPASARTWTSRRQGLDPFMEASIGNPHCYDPKRESSFQRKSSPLIPYVLLLLVVPAAVVAPADCCLGSSMFSDPLEQYTTMFLKMLSATTTTTTTRTTVIHYDCRAFERDNHNDNAKNGRAHSFHASTYSFPPDNKKLRPLVLSRPFKSASHMKENKELS